MSLALALLYTAGSLWLAVTLLWLASVLLHDASIIDICWGPLFVLIAWVLYAAADPGSQTRSAGEPLLMLLLVTLWGLRLGLHLYARNHGRGEDPRYARWRARGGARWWWQSYFRVFCLQGGIALIVAAPIVGAMQAPDAALLSARNAIAVAVWLLGFGIELQSDLQLQRYRASGGREPLDSGLWHYTRHPNYLGDALQWWGLGLLAFSAANWWVLLGPLTMTLVFVRVSIGILERRLAEQRPGYTAYRARTPAFLPWLPRRHG